MTRPLTDIYQSLVLLVRDKRASYSFPSVPNHSGDIQVISTDTLGEMFDMLIDAANNARKDTKTEVYAGKEYIFDTAGPTSSSSQRAAITEFMGQGYYCSVM